MHPARTSQGPSVSLLTLLAASTFGVAGCAVEAQDAEPLPSSGGFAGLPASGGAPSAGAGGSGTGGSGTGGSGGTGVAGAATGGTGGTMMAAGAPGTGGSGAGTGGSSAGAGAAGSPAAGAPNAGAGGSSAGSSGAGGSAGSAAGSGGSAGAAAGAGGSAGKAGSGGSGGMPVVDLEACKNTPVPAVPAAMQETIDITWTEMTGGFSGMQGARGNNRTIGNYPSWAMDHVMWSGGELNFCVRWDSTQPVSETLRDQIEDTLSRGVNAWFSALTGYDCFPYPTIDVKVTGWAVANRSTLMWADDTIVPIYVGQMQEGAPTCPAACSRFSHQDPDYEFASCAAGPENRFDQFVWLEEGYNAPNGWDMGCHLNQAGFSDAAAQMRLYHIWLHEFGHSVGFPDYYDWNVWAPGVAKPVCVMNAGAAATVTDWDKAMFKKTWSEQLRDDRW